MKITILKGNRIRPIKAKKYKNTVIKHCFNCKNNLDDDCQKECTYRNKWEKASEEEMDQKRLRNC